MAKTWDYRVHAAANTVYGDEAALNRFGEDGWELVAVITDTYYKWFYLKREREGNV